MSIDEGDKIEFLVNEAISLAESRHFFTTHDSPVIVNSTTHSQQEDVKIEKIAHEENDIVAEASLAADLHHPEKRDEDTTCDTFSADIEQCVSSHSSEKNPSENDGQTRRIDFLNIMQGATEVDSPFEQIHQSNSATFSKQNNLDSPLDPQTSMSDLTAYNQDVNNVHPTFVQTKVDTASVSSLVQSKTTDVITHLDAKIKIKFANSHSTLSSDNILITELTELKPNICDMPLTYDPKAPGSKDRILNLYEEPDSDVVMSASDERSIICYQHEHLNNTQTAEWTHDDENNGEPTDKSIKISPCKKYVLEKALDSDDNFPQRLDVENSSESRQTNEDSFDLVSNVVDSYESAHDIEDGLETALDSSKTTRSAEDNGEATFDLSLAGEAKPTQGESKYFIYIFNVKYIDISRFFLVCYEDNSDFTLLMLMICIALLRF